MLRPVTRWQVSSCQVLGVIAGSLEGLAHGYQMIAFADWLPFGILYMPDNHQIAQAVELGIVAEHYQGPGDIALDKGFAGIPDYNRHNRSHRDQLAQIMAIHAGANGAKTVHSVQQPIADALPLSNEFQASQELSRLHLGANPGDQPGYAVVDFMIGAIQFLFVVAYRVQGVFGAGFQPRQQSVPRCLSRVTTGLSPLQYLRRGERGKLGGGIGDSGCRRPAPPGLLRRNSTSDPGCASWARITRGCDAGHRLYRSIAALPQPLRIMVSPVKIMGSLVLLILAVLRGFGSLRQ